MIKKEMNKIITTLVVGGVLVSVGTAASVFANSSVKTSTNNATVQTCPKHRGGDMQNTFNTKLDTLVKSGTITQDQENKIVDYFKNKMETRKTEKDKFKNMTSAERKQYLQNNKGTNKKNQRPNALAELVKAGTITQNQADAIQKIMPVHKRDGKWNGLKNNAENMKTKLDTIVKSGAITQDQENKIVNYFNTKKDERKTEMDKVKNMTEAERQKYFGSKMSQNKDGKRPDPFAELVKAGTITQDQANTIKNALMAHNN